VVRQAHHERRRIGDQTGKHQHRRGSQPVFGLKGAPVLEFEVEEYLFSCCHFDRREKSAVALFHLSSHAPTQKQISPRDRNDSIPRQFDSSRSRFRAAHAIDAAELTLFDMDQPDHLSGS
jgi:hypothetical protein